MLLSLWNRWPHGKCEVDVTVFQPVYTKTGNPHLQNVAEILRCPIISKL